MAYVKATKTEGDTDVPSDCWARGIRELHPIRVYLHRANLVVVQKVAGEIERGKYIQGPVSSYIPHPQAEDDGFEFSDSGTGYGVYNFKRTTSL